MPPRNEFFCSDDFCLSYDGDYCHQVTDREMQDFSQSQLMDQGSMHNSGIDIPKRKDKEDLTESSEVCHATYTHVVETNMRLCYGCSKV